MDAASPLIFLLLAVVLVIATVESASTRSGFPATSSIITYVIASIFAVIGGGTLLYRRMQEGGDDDGVNSWSNVLRVAVGPGVAKVVGDLLTHGIWVLVLISTVLLTMYLTMDSGIINVSLLSPLALMGFALIGVLGVSALLLSPAVSVMHGTGRMENALNWLRKQSTSPRVLGYLVLAVLLTVLLTLGRIYPVVGGFEVVVMGNIGSVLIDEATPLSTSISKTVPGLSRWGSYGRSENGGTSNYTLAWWQFINSRPRTQEVTVLELGPVGLMRLGPGPNTAVLSLTSAAPKGVIEQVRLPIKLQKWQHIVLRASGNRTDVFMDGQLVGTNMHPPVSLRQGDIFTIPGTVPRETQGGIAKFTFSPKAEPYSTILLSYRSPPSVVAKED